MLKKGVQEFFEKRVLNAQPNSQLALLGISESEIPERVLLRQADPDH